MLFIPSIHEIITNVEQKHNVNDIHALFTNKTYPAFQLTEFKRNDQLLANQKFVYFVSLLQEWNKKIESESKKQQKGMDYQLCQNEFIYGSLKRLSVKNSSQSEQELNKLYSWFTQQDKEEIRCHPKQSNNLKTDSDQWEIRNSYKSNLPFQIDMYRRRYLFDTSQKGVKANPMMNVIQAIKKDGTEEKLDTKLKEAKPKKGEFQDKLPTKLKIKEKLLDKFIKKKI